MQIQRQFLRKINEKYKNKQMRKEVLKKENHLSYYIKKDGRSVVLKKSITKQLPDNIPGWQECGFKEKYNQNNSPTTSQKLLK